MDRARAALVLAVAGGSLGVVQGASCPGTVQLVSDETDAPLPVSFVPTGWGSPDGGSEFEVDSSGNVIPHMGSRAYFALECTPGEYDNKKYMGMNLLGRTMRYTVDLSGAGCGCNAAFYLTSMNLNEEKSECGDHYCDANNVCGESCAEIDIQEANKYSWHSTLHTESDPSGVGGGYGGGGKDWSGPRDWTGMEYSPGGKCIDTSEPFNVAASFPVNATGWLTGMVVVLSQAGHSCKLKTSITSYEGMEELSRAIRAGMTPIVSYWSDDDMLWMDGLGKDEKGPCHSDSAASCSETVKFSNFSVGDLDPEVRDTASPAPAPAASSGREEEASAGAFCCLSSRDEADFCGSCPAYARAGPSSHCGLSEANCAACGGQATWCVAASQVQELTPSPTLALAAEAADTPAPTAGPSPAEAPSAAPTPELPARAPRAAGGGFCCLASMGTGAGFCGQCFQGGRALPGSKCGSSRSDCEFCGGQATWCEEKEEEAAVQAAAGGGGGEGQCCLAAMDSGDFCGTCFPNAIANSSSRCGSSRAACEDCGGGSQWCGARPRGDDEAAALVLRGLEGPADDAEPFDCKAGLAKWESGWSNAKKSWCCEVKGSPCPETTTAAAETAAAAAAAETTAAAADTTPSAPEAAPKTSNGTAAANFCCLASSDVDDFCGSCLRPAKSGQDAPCGSDQSSCRACSAKARWCSPEASRGEAVSAAPAEAADLVKEGGSNDSFCCLAASETSDVCGTCFENAKANRSSHCGASEKSCGTCGGMAAWCSAAGGAKHQQQQQQQQEQQRDSSVNSSESARAVEPTAASFCCLAAAEDSGSSFCGTCFANARAEGDSHCGQSKDACEDCGGSARWCDAPSGSDAFAGDAEDAGTGGSGHTGAASETTTSATPKSSTTASAAPKSSTTTSGASKSSTTGAAPKSTTTSSAAPKPACPGMVEIQAHGLSDLPAQIVPTGWGSKYGPVPVQVANYSTITANMGARAYFAMSCAAGHYSNQDYMALNLLGWSLRYTVDLSGAECGCNAALYLTSMRQNKNSSSCSDYYCDANSVCGVACAEIDIQEANMHSWHSTLHGRDDPNGVGGGFGGGGEEWSGPRDWNASQYSPGGSCIDTRRPFDVDAAFPVDAEGSLAGLVVTLSQEGKSCPLSTRTVGYAGMPELTEALRAGMTPIVSYWSADDMLWMDGAGKDKLGACKKDRPSRCAESVRFSNFSVGVAPTLPPTAAPTPAPTSEPTPEPTAAPTGTPTAEPTVEPTAAPTPAPTRPAGFCCLAAPNPFDYCGSCPGFAMAPEGSGCAASEDSCNQCGGLSKWCEIDDSKAETFTTSHAPKNSKKAPVRALLDNHAGNKDKSRRRRTPPGTTMEATVRLGAREVVAEVIGKPRGGDAGPGLQGKYGGGALPAAAQQLQRRGQLPDIATLLGLPGLAVMAFASLAWLRRRRRAAAEADVDPPLSARPMVQAEDSELELA